jgi:predicted nucleotide-binding protein (sugar kinase/HSP70/actin superfamily)
MPNNSPILCFPYFGKYTSLFKKFFENWGLKIILPPKITDKTIKIGSRHSSEMMCFPYKVTLGNFIEAIEEHPEIEYLLMYNTLGRCRFRHYHILQKQALEDLGYKIKMVVLSKNNFLKFPKQFNLKLNKIQIIKNYWHLYKNIKEVSKTKKILEEKPNVIVIGEIYTCIENSSNYDIEKRLEDFNINLINTVNLYSFFKDAFKSRILGGFLAGKYHQLAQKYLDGPIGGHGLENIKYLLEYIDKGIQGVVWFRPLSCMPETTIDPIIKKICLQKNVPLLIFDIDESNFALNIETRLETFVEQVKSKYKYETEK